MAIEEFDFSVDLLKAILWQYDNAEKMKSLLTKKQEWYLNNQTDFWDNWQRDVFNLETANEFGLSVWSIILRVPIIVTNQEPDGEIKFGFDPATDGNFNNSNFSPQRFRAQELSSDSARLVLQLRYNQLVSNGTVIDTNRFLSYIFRDRGRAYVIDNYDMTIDYVFEFALPFSISYVLANYDILPRPAGVQISNINIVPQIPFGFEAFNNNFDQGNFL